MNFLTEDGLRRLWIHIIARIGGKVDAVEGKGLSTNDYTNEDKTKLDGIEVGANKTIIDTSLVNSGAAADAKVTGDKISAHSGNKSNPHEVTVDQIGAVPTSRTVNGKALTENISLAASDVGAEASGATSVHNTSESAHQDIRDLISSNTVDLTNHTGNTTVHITSDERASWNNKSDSGHKHNASDITGGTLSIERGGTGYSGITDTTYATARYRASALVSSETSPTINGVINWVYE